MPDETYTDAVMPSGGFDDDRLLAYVLGLDEDAALAAAAATDAELRARLETIRAQADAVGARISAAVPAPDDSYADLSAPRWADLGEFLRTPDTTPLAARTRSSRWLRVAAPALVVVLALAVGAAVLSSRGGSGGTGSHATAENAESPALGASAQDGVPSSSAGSSSACSAE